MKNITLRQLRAFVAVAHTHSFTLASEKLFMTQSALSGLIRELESGLGLRLIDRNTRRLALSEVGRNIYPLIEKSLHDIDAVMEEVKHLKQFNRGVVRVAAPQLMSCTILPTIMQAFQNKHPQVEVSLLDCAVDQVTARVFSGEVDIGLGPEREPNSDIEAQLLFKQAFVAVLPPKHPLLTKKQLRWHDLSPYPVISLQGQFTERLSFELRTAMRDLQVKCMVTFMSTALAMVEQGLGVTICMPYAQSLIHRYGLETRPLIAPKVQRNFYLFTRKHQTPSPAVEAFCAFMHQQSV